MPRPDGTLTPEEISTAGAALKYFWSLAGGRKPCPQCGHDQYFIIPQLNGNRSDTLNPNGPHFRFPTVMVTCQRCGYLDQYLATSLGIQWLTADEIAAPPAPPSPEEALGRRDKDIWDDVLGGGNG